MSDALDDFIEELRAVKHNAETLEMMEAFFYRLKHGDNSLAIQVYDDVVDIVRRKSPLHEREIAIVHLLSDWLRNDDAETR
jgi:hypothetical protein